MQESGSLGDFQNKMLPLLLLEQLLSAINVYSNMLGSIQLKIAILILIFALGDNQTLKSRDLCQFY